MSIINPEKIDAVAQMANGEIVLAIAEVESWSGDSDQLRLVAAKFKNYTAYALDGQLVRNYPEAAEAIVNIQLHYGRKLPHSIDQLIGSANQTYGSLKLKFTTKRVS